MKIKAIFTNINFKSHKCTDQYTNMHIPTQAEKQAHTHTHNARTHTQAHSIWLQPCFSTCQMFWATPFWGSPALIRPVHNLKSLHTKPNPSSTLTNLVQRQFSQSQHSPVQAENVPQTSLSGCLAYLHPWPFSWHCVVQLKHSRNQSILVVQVCTPLFPPPPPPPPVFSTHTNVLSKNDFQHSEVYQQQTLFLWGGWRDSYGWGGGGGGSGGTPY